MLKVTPCDADQALRICVKSAAWLKGFVVCTWNRASHLTSLTSSSTSADICELLESHLLPLFHGASSLQIDLQGQAQDQDNHHTPLHLHPIDLPSPRNFVPCLPPSWLLRCPFSHPIQSPPPPPPPPSLSSRPPSPLSPIVLVPPCKRVRLTDRGGSHRRPQKTGGR